MSNIQFQTEHLFVFESALFRTTSTIFYNDDLVLLVDPTWLPKEIEFIKKTLNRIRDQQVLYLLFTHSDYDHIIAYNAFPDAKVIVSKAFVDNPNKDKILQQIKDFDDEYYIARDYKIAYPIADLVISKVGETIVNGQTSLHFYPALGHNQDGMFTIIEPYGILIAGDYLSNIEFPYIYFDSYAYEKTLDTFDLLKKEYAINLLIPGHGDITDNEKEMNKRVEDSRKYIKELRRSILEKDIDPFDEMIKHYQFPKIMKQFHLGNIALMKKELGIK